MRASGMIFSANVNMDDREERPLNAIDKKMKIPKMKRVLPAAVCAWCLAEAAWGNPGELDPTFGQGGLSRIALPSGSTLHASTVQPDGKILAVGSAQNNFLIVRLNGDGTADTSFDGDGIKSVGYGTDIESAGAVVTTSDNKILVGGVSYRFPSANFGDGALIRLNQDGSLDTTFGQSGIVYSNHTVGTYIEAMVPLSDGKIILGGGTDNTQGQGDLIVFRINPNGSIDTTFGSTGRTVLDFDQFGDDFSGLAVLQDGRIVIAGSSQRSTTRQMSVARLQSNGQLDTSNPPGKFSFNVGLGDRINDVSLQSDGKLLLASHLETGNFRGLGMVVRLNPDGSRDSSFGSNGRIVRVPSASAITSDSNGRVYFVGETLADNWQPSPGRSIVHALEYDGSAATAFGRAGRTTIDAGNAALPSTLLTFDLRRLSDGRLLVFGKTANAELVVARLLASGEHGGVISIVPAFTTANANTGVSEAAGSVNFTVMRTGGTTGAVTVNYAASSSVATAGVDFTAIAGTLSWEDGESASKTISLPLLDDNDYEASNELVRVTLSSPTSGAVLGTSAAGVSVSSDEQQAYIQGSAIVVLANAGSATVPFQRMGDPRIRATVQYATRSGGATVGTDFQPVSGTLVWEAGDVGDKAVTIPILDNTGTNNDVKGFIIDLSNAGNGTTISDPGSATVEIRPYQQASGGLQFDRSANVVTESSGSVSLNVRPTGNLSNPITLNVVAASYSTRVATAGVDYVTPNQTVSWAAGDSTPRTITISLLDDALSEGTEVIDVTLSIGQNNYARTRIVVLDDDLTTGPSQFQITQSALTVSESVGSALLTVTRSGNLSFPSSVEWRAVYDTARNGDISTPMNPATLNWLAGDAAAKTISIPIYLDTIVEQDEAFKIQLFNPQGGTVLGAAWESSITITEWGGSSAIPTVGFSQSTFTVSEDAEYIDLPLVRIGGTDFAAYYYLLSAVAGRVADFDSEFTLETDEEFVGFYATPNPPYPSSIRVYLNGDAKVENDETLTVLLRGRVTELPIGPNSTATITLVSGDPVPAPAEIVLQSTASVAEQAGSVSITVNRTGSASSAISVNYQTVSGTAAAGTDFVAASGTISWPAGDLAAKTITIAITNDGSAESTESFTVVLSSPTNATVAGGTATISILDGAGPPAPAVNPPPNNNSGGGSLRLEYLLVLVALRAGRRWGVRRETNKK